MGGSHTPVILNVIVAAVIIVIAFDFAVVVYDTTIIFIHFIIAW